MDTKSKKFKDWIVWRAIVFIVCVGLFTSVITGGLYILGKYESGVYIGWPEDFLNMRSYEESANLRVYQQGYGEILASLVEAERISVDRDRAENIKEGLDRVDGLKYYIEAEDKASTNLSGSRGENVTAKTFEKEPAYFVYDSGKLSYNGNKDGNGHYQLSWLKTSLDNVNYSGDLKVYMSFDKDFMADMTAAYEKTEEELKTLVPAMAAATLLGILLLIWLCVTTGGVMADGRRRLYRLDKVWTEVQLGILFIVAFLGIEALDSFFGSRVFYGYNQYYGEIVYHNGVPMYSMYELALVAAAVFAAGTVFLWIFLSMIRLLKARCFLKNFLIYRLFAAIGRAIINVINGGSLTRKVVLVTLILCVLSATIFLAPVVIIGIIVLAPAWVRKFEAIQKGVDEVKSGNLTYKINIENGKGSSELVRLAEGINQISEASNLAVHNELKNQRMKTELISNVSHDLKTPLTSMVTYIDLLKTEGLDSPDAPKYLEILDQKTERLRKLTEDLFEAAKASSGAIPVNMEKVDILSLVNQSMGEMNDRISASGLEFIVNAPEEKYYVTADGQLLWRVTENLLGNVLKYAQEGSRVYIDIKEAGKAHAAESNQASGNGGGIGRSGLVVLEIKNMSKQALNIDPDELMERFKRGDESRTTEGSGLGLAIAKDLVKLMGGWFEVSIDGDLFKVQVVLNRAE